MTGCQDFWELLWLAKDRWSSGNIWEKDRVRKATTCSGSLVLRRQEGERCQWRDWCQSSPCQPRGKHCQHTVSGATSPMPESRTTSQVPWTLFLALECAGPPLRLTFQLPCSAKRSQLCQTSTGDSGATPQLITPQQGKNWLCKAVAGKIIMQGRGEMGCKPPPPRFLRSILCRDP